MSKDELSSFQMYEKLLQQEAIDSSFGSILARSHHDEEDAEVFMTSKELVKNKEKLEELGIVAPIQHDEEPETIHFKRYNKRREHKYTEKEMEVIRNSCYNTIVHDYGTFDWYHVSDEERKKHDDLAEISLKLAKIKRTYRRLDQYIEAMRVVYQAWEMLSKNNFVHTKKEFFSMIAEGRIVSNRIIMPKLKRLDQFNIDMIIGYISNPDLDISHLAPKKVESDIFIPDDEIETDEEEMARLLSEEDIQYLLQYEDNPEPLEVETVKPRFIKGYNQRNLKRRKNESKEDFAIRKSLSRMLQKIESSSHYKGFGRSYMITHSLFEPVKETKSFWDDMKFNGSWASDSDAFLYDIALNERMMEERPPNERYLTYGDKALDKFFRTLEDNGVSTIDLRRRMGNVTSNKIKEKITKKENRRREASIIQRIEKLNKSSKFKKIANKAEEALSRYREGE